MIIITVIYISRSGHTACLLKKHARKMASASKFHLVLFGGRDSDSVDVFGDWEATGLFAHLDSSSMEEKLQKVRTVFKFSVELEYQLDICYP